MAYQILGLRDRPIPGTNKTKPIPSFESMNWGTKNVEDIFKRPQEILKEVPEVDRWNLFFTVADCFEGQTRKLKEQWLLPFDIDNIGVESDVPEHNMKLARKVLDVCYAALGLDKNKTASIFSGNGVQFFVKMKAPILSDDYFHSARDKYYELTEKINKALAAAGLKGKTDGVVFSASRLMRMPETINKKKNKGERKAFVVDANLEEQDFTLGEIDTKKDEEKESDNISKKVWKSYGPPDSEAVLAGCEFLKYAKTNAKILPEPLWFFEAGIYAFLPEGDKLFHESSEQHPDYNMYEAQQKLDNYRLKSGPIRCKTVARECPEACKICKFDGKLGTPLAIKGPNYIKTKDTGFREQLQDKEGKLKQGKLIYEDLIKQFLIEFNYKRIEKNGAYIYSDGAKKWTQLGENFLESWCREKVNHKPSVSEMREFKGRMDAVNVENKSWVSLIDTKHINFNNGVFKKETKELKPHGPEYNFKYCLPFDYNPNAKAPKFLEFMEQITCGDKDSQKLILEFLGYAISGDEYWAQKALLLVGDGANGKSTLFNILRYIAGEDNCSSLTMEDLNDKTARYGLVNKLFNSTEETNSGAFLKTETFKNLSGGGTVQVRHLFEQPHAYTNTAKFILAANELPRLIENTYGLKRRFITVKLKAKFDEKTADPKILQKLMAEASGIYNILLDHYTIAKNNGTFSETEDSRIAVEEMNESPERIFLEEYIQKVEDGYALTNDVYSAYCNFYETDGHIKTYKKSKIALSKIIKTKIPEVEITVKRDGDKMSRVYKGIKLVEGAII